MSSIKAANNSSADRSLQNVKIRLSSFASSVVDKATADLVVALRKVSAVIVGPIPLPNTVVSVPINKSPHVDGKSKEKLQLTRHYRMITILNASSTDVDAISYISIPSGVGIEIQVTNRKKQKPSSL